MIRTIAPDILRTGPAKRLFRRPPIHPKLSISGIVPKLNTSMDNAPKYRLTLTLWVMEQQTITGIWKWDDGSSGVAPEPVFYPLPEDEIGAYALRNDGTKEYLIYQTYDICMQYLGSEELCEGNQRCFHKQGVYGIDWWPVVIK